jgi:2-keto-4-pentenoate hydratase/2-oxohepta-3-ene-1,7-dioic acid hydratase in catechol pathway
VKLATFTDPDGRTRCGALNDGQLTVIDELASMRALFESGEDPRTVAAGANGETVSLDDAKLRAPIIPKKFFHTSGNYREHEEESKTVGWSHEIAPWIVFFQNIDAIIGPDDPIVYPSHLTNELDHELELALVLNRAGRHFEPDEAESYIGGYLIFNDITARDIQRREMRSGVFSFCKSIDTFCPLGPWIVTPDEITDPYRLHMELRVNGELRQQSVTGNMSHTIPEVIAHYSALDYSPGDVLSLGTVAGVAGFREDAHDFYLKPGDLIECEIERIGILRNPVISWEEAHGVPAPPLRRW